MPIRRLPPSLINKIAAGEVIERPAAVVKELMENSLDAGAARVDVAVERGGLELIRVVDNGCGIPADELPLALEGHATSKLVDDDDLFHVRTLGFRGEALASIAEVSRLLIRSRTSDSPCGGELRAEGGRVGEVVPCSWPQGTCVEVRNLFFNTPVRRKFLRAATTEFGHVSEAFIRIALVALNVHITLRHNEKPVFDLPAGVAWVERIAAFFGRELAENLIWVESKDGEVRLAGYVAQPAHSRSHNRMQYLFLNGRYIRDRMLQHALGEAYRGLLIAGRFPIAFLTLTMPPELVDVNVHPTKLEVRFQDAGRLYSQLLATLRSKFLTSDLHTQVHLGVGHAQAEETGPEAAAHDTAQTALLRQQLVDWAKGKVASWASDSQHPTAAANETVSSHTALSMKTPATPFQALQVHNRYLVAETEEGVTIIDQHALHERILYEQLREKLNAGPLESQSLLAPEPLDLSPIEAAALSEHKQLLSELGIKIEPFGGDTVLLTAYPAMLANVAPVELVRTVLERLLSGGRLPERRDLFDQLLHDIACKAAVKAGERLSPEEIAALLAQRHLVADAHHCPHGRPAALVFTREELDQHFRRK